MAVSYNNQVTYIIRYILNRVKQIFKFFRQVSRVQRLIYRMCSECIFRTWRSLQNDGLCPRARRETMVGLRQTARIIGENVLLLRRCVVSANVCAETLAPVKSGGLRCGGCCQGPRGPGKHSRSATWAVVFPHLHSVGRNSSALRRCRQDWQSQT